MHRPRSRTLICTWSTKCSLATHPWKQNLKNGSTKIKVLLQSGMWAREKCKFINSWKHKFQKRLLICQNLATSLSDIQLFFVVLLNPPKTPQAPWACLQLCIDIIVCFALPLGNGLIVRKNLQCKRTLAINRMHRFKCTLNWLCNWYFMKLNMLNMCSFSTEPNTWTTTIFGSFMYFESLWLRMRNAVSLCQS